MENWYVSPNFKLDKLASGKLEDKIDVFGDRFKNAIIIFRICRHHKAATFSRAIAKREHENLIFPCFIFNRSRNQLK